MPFQEVYIKTKAFKVGYLLLSLVRWLSSDSLIADEQILPLCSQQLQIDCKILSSLTQLFMLSMQWGNLNFADISLVLGPVELLVQLQQLRTV